MAGVALQQSVGAECRRVAQVCHPRALPAFALMGQTISLQRSRSSPRTARPCTKPGANNSSRAQQRRVAADWQSLIRLRWVQCSDADAAARRARAPEVWKHQLFGEPLCSSCRLLLSTRCGRAALALAPLLFGACRRRRCLTPPLCYPSPPLQRRSLPGPEARAG